MKPTFGFCLLLALSLYYPTVWGQDDVRRTASVAVLEKVQPAVAVVYAFDKDGRRLGTGSGSVIDPRGYVLTAKHVVADRHIVLLGGRPPLTASLVGKMPEFDVAILRLGRPAFSRPGSPKYPRDGLPPDFVTLGVDEEVRMGETVFNIGAPGGRGIVASRGIVSAVAFTGVNPLSISLQSSTAFDEMIQFDAASNPGNSGGPLINLLGQQIGMVVSGIHTEEGIHFAIPTKTIRHCIPQVLCSELQRRYRSGIAIDPQLATVEIAKVDSDSPAAKAGIQVGDQILSVDGRPLRDPIDWAFSQAEWKPEQTLLFEILRGQELVEAKIKLAERTRLKSVVSPDVQSGLACRYTSYDPRVPSPLDQVKRPEGKVIVMDTVQAHPETLELQDHYVLWVEGLLKIEESGRYRFGLSSDDGSKLYLHNQILIDNDGNHAEILRTAWADLEKGLHPIRVEFYEDEGNQSLKLLMAKDDEELAAVEANVLFHVSEE